MPTRTTSAACRTCCPYFPGVPVYASTLARGLLGFKIKEHKLTNNPLLRLRRGRDGRAGRVLGDGVPHRPLDPRRDGHRAAHAGRPGRPHRRLQVRPHAGRRQAVRHPRAGASSAARACCACCPTRRARRARATRRPSASWARSSATSWKASTAASSWPPSPATSPASSRSSMPRGTFDRKVTVIGRSMEQNVRIATDLGYLKYPADLLVPKDRLKDIPDNKLVIATTGAQGEPMAGLARMANRDHRWVEIQPGDTVIVSASPIPGNEEVVGRTIDNLFKVGANVFYHDIKRAHVSGHASQEELKLMLNLTRPKHFIPMHGEFRMLVQHGRLAARPGRRAGQHLHHRERPADRVLGGRHGAPGHARRGRLRVRRRAVGRRGGRRGPARPARPRGRRHVPRRGDRRQADRQPHRPARDRRRAASSPARTTRSSRAPPIESPRPSRTPATTPARSRCSRRRSRTASSQYLYDRTKRRPMVFPVVVEV